MHFKRTLLTLCFLCILCGFTGCDSTSAERIAAAKSVVTQANSASQFINSSIGDTNGTITALDLMMADPNIPAETKLQIQSTLSAARAKLNALIPQKQKVDAVLAQAQAILNSIDMNDVSGQTEFNAYGAMVTTVAPSLPPPISGYVYLAGLMIPVIGGLGVQIARQVNKIKQQNAQINQSKAVLTDVVTSVDTLLDPTKNNGIIPAANIEAAKVILMSNQTGVTSDLVDAIHDPMQNTAPTK